MSTFAEQIAPAVEHAIIVGDYIPAHDRCFDLGEEIAANLVKFHRYVASVRDVEQADEAVRELVACTSEQLGDTPNAEEEPDRLEQISDRVEHLMVDEQTLADLRWLLARAQRH